MGWGERKKKAQSFYYTCNVLLNSVGGRRETLTSSLLNTATLTCLESTAIPADTARATEGCLLTCNTDCIVIYTYVR